MNPTLAQALLDEAALFLGLAIFWGGGYALACFGDWLQARLARRRGAE